MCLWVVGELLCVEKGIAFSGIELIMTGQRGVVGFMDRYTPPPHSPTATADRD